MPCDKTRMQIILKIKQKTVPNWYYVLLPRQALKPKKIETGWTGSAALVK